MQLNRISELHSKGIISTDEARSTFGYQPIDNGDEPLVDLNRAPLSALKDYQQAKINKQNSDIDALKGGDEND